MGRSMPSTPAKQEQKRAGRYIPIMLHETDINEYPETRRNWGYADTQHPLFNSGKVDELVTKVVAEGLTRDEARLLARARSAEDERDG